jgi:hypothetical protein
MHIPHPRKAKEAICCIAATIAYTGQSKFQPDVRRRDPLTVHQDLPQEVTVIPVPAPKEKATVAAAAPSAQMSALASNPIVPPVHRNAMGFNPFFCSTPPFAPLPNHKTFPLPA